jgi:O-antigen ligase
VNADRSAVAASIQGPDARTAAVAIVLGLLAGVIAVGAAPSTAAALVLAGGALGVAGVTALIVVARSRVGDALLLTAVAAMAIPLDKYFAVRDHVGGWPGVRVSAADAALITLLPIAVIGVLTRRVHNAVPPVVYGVYALLLFQYGLSVANASERDLAMFEMLAAVHAIAVAAVVGLMFRRELIRPFVAVVALHVVLHTAFAVAQVATGRPVGAEWFTTATIVPEALTTGVVRLRPIGLFDHPIVYANALMLSLPVLFVGLMLGGGRLWQMFIATSMVVGLAGLGLTLSRGAWVSTAIAAAWLFASLRIRRLMTARQLGRLVTAVAIAVLIVGVPLAPRIWDRLTASDPGNLNVRFELNWIAVSMIEAHPFVGVGLSNFIPVMERFDPTNVMRRFPAVVHNIYLLEGAEAGVPGLLLFVTLLLVVQWCGWRAWRRTSDRPSQLLGAAILAGLAGFAISQLADFSHRVEPMRSMVWMYVGVLFAVARAPRPVDDADG